jgi:hypothetical protein
MTRYDLGGFLTGLGTVLLGAWLALLGTPAVCATGGGCDLEPIKPLPPLGCLDLVATCQCEARGEDCRWVWTCVPDA